MRIQIIHNQYYFLGIRIHNINKITDFFCPVQCCSMLTDTYMMYPGKRLNKSKNAASPISDILLIDFFVISRTHRPGIPCFAKQLIWLFIHTHNRNLRIIGEFVYIQYIFHIRYEFRICFCWDTPVLSSVRFKPNYFRVLRIASLLIGSSSTTFNSSSSNRIVHLLCPSGTDSQAICTIFASVRPSTLRLALSELTLRLSLASRPFPSLHTV